MKKIAGDKKSSTFQHPNGHKMVIAHSGVSTLQRKQLESMPITEDPANLHQHPDMKHVSESGMIKAANDLYGNPDSSNGQFAEGGASDDAVQSPESEPVAVATNPSDASVSEENATSPAPESQERAPASSAPAPQGKDPFSLRSVYDAQNKAIDLQSQGEQQVNTMKAKQLENQAKFEHDFQNTQKQLSDNLSGYMSHFMDEDNKVKGEIAKGMINPKRYVENMSTGSKIATGIGIILGGIGSARTGQPNYAYDYLQKQIDRDIEAQKSNMGQENNLLSHNVSVMGNMIDGVKLSQIQIGDLVHSQLAEEAGKSASPIAKAQNQVVQAQWMQKKAELQKQLALSQAMINSGGGGTEGEFQGKVSFLRMNGMTDLANALEQHHVPGVPGATSVPATQENRQALNHFNNLQNLYKEADEYLNHAGALGAGWQNANKAKGQSIMQRMNLEMGQLAQLNRFTSEESKHYNDLIPDLTGTHFTNQDSAKLMELKNELSSKMQNEYKAMGIRPPASSMNPSSGEMRRIVKSGPHAGKIAVYDKSKKFLRWGN